MRLRRTAVLAVLLLTACAGQPTVERAPSLKERVVLLPSDTDRPSAVVVKIHDAEVLLDTPYTSADLRGSALESSQLAAHEVNHRYSGLLTAQPPKPQPFTMYFEPGSDQLTPASRIEFEKARQRIASWLAAEVVVIGHTDRVGSEDYNDMLSRQRAQAIARRLVSSGVPTNAIEVAARGERDPLIPTPDGAVEPRNRRVEIKVR
jgi:outer membrane protein OmpA-like peptidoglycan-associated protein